MGPDARHNPVYRHSRPQLDPVGKVNEWQRTRQRSGWKHGGFAEWIEGNTAYLSVVFSWQKQTAFQWAVWLRAQGYAVRVGGPAVDYDPEFFSESFLDTGYRPGDIDALSRHNPNATFTSRGCIRRCSFCAVPIIEGDLVELDDWPVRPIICDNNLLACSRAHFDRVIDRLKPVPQVDFNQGLDARLLTDYHAGRLAELDLHLVRLAWDNTKGERRLTAAMRRLWAAGIPKARIRVYILIGYDDTPDDALYRLETVRGLGIMPNPMRYQPLDATRRNEYVAPGWTERELKRFMRYWSNLRHLRSIPFAEFAYGGGDPRPRPIGQLLEGAL